MDSVSSLIKSLIEYTKTRQNFLLTSSLTLVATIFISVAVSYHLAVSKIHITNNDMKKILNESHNYINKTITNDLDGLKNELETLKRQISSQDTSQQSEIDRLKTKVRDLKRNATSIKSDFEQARTAVLETIEQRIASSESNTANRIDNLDLKYKIDIKKVLENANITDNDIDDLQEKFGTQRDELISIDYKSKENSKKLKEIIEDMNIDRKAVRNLTSMYTKIVLQMKLFLKDDNSTNDLDAAAEIMRSLEVTMTNLQDSRIQDAITSYNRTIQTYFENSKNENNNDLESVKTAMKSIVEKMSDFMHKSLGYINIPHLGFVHIHTSESLRFRYS